VVTRMKAGISFANVQNGDIGRKEIVEFNRRISASMVVISRCAT